MYKRYIINCLYLFMYIYEVQIIYTHHYFIIKIEIR
jgi:hypothetical protein